jgi:signal transduction histidine kinase
MAELVHDHLQQLLVAARMRLVGTARLVRDDDALRLLEDAGAILADATDVSRSLAVDLQPPVLYDAGLGAALQWLAGWMREQHRLDVTVSIDEQAEPPDEGTRALLFTAARELLFNVVKHAAVPRARLLLRTARGRRIRLEVLDGGVGFDLAAADARRGFGLFGIRERLRALGGDMRIRTRPGAGTNVVLVVPAEAPVPVAPPAL